ncbi:MAG: hypothetical protein KDC90_05865 [Ignavibacteriae bacterium]|nr:hypothetical protein [Ignavibacteriota bacterium]
MNLFLKIIIILLSIFLASCSTTEVTKTEKPVQKIVKKYTNDVELNVEKTISWVNLMPGTLPKFHVSGKFTLLKNKDYDLEKTKLKFIKIYQDEKEFYFIQPKVLEEISDESKVITYSTIQGLSINKDLNQKKGITFELVFKEGNSELKYYVENVKVEEVQ